MDFSGLNPISPRLHELLELNPQAYSRLLVTGSTPAASREALKDLSPEQLLAVPVKSRPHAFAMLAGVWLWFDGLAESHEIAQADPRNLQESAPTPGRLKVLRSSGSDAAEENTQAEQEKALPDAGKCLAFWHAILHRLEGDFSNSQYWYAKVGDHPILPAIGAQVTAAINHLPADKSLLRLLQDGWNPYALVDLVEQVNDRPGDPRLQTVIAIQKVEWQLLFDHCTRQASGQ